MSTVIGITGANGALGSLTIEELIRQKFAGKIVAISRDPTRTKNTIADHPSVELRKADFSDISSLSTAFDGIHRLLIVSTNSPVNRVNQHKNAFKAAKEAGVKHIAYTSTANVQPHPFPLFQEHYESEEALKSVGVSYSILRNNFYIESFVENDKSLLSQGHPVIALGKGKIAYISRGDCARAAASVLTSSNSENKIYNISGPESLSIDEITKIYSEVLSREVKRAVISVEQYREILEKIKVPEIYIYKMLKIQELAQEGKFDVASNDFEKLTGRKAITYKSISEIVFA